YGPNATMCQDEPCGYDQYQNRMFCWKPGEQAVCPQGCYCLTKDEAYGKLGTNATMCQEQPCGYAAAATGAAQIAKYCWKPTTQETQCPGGCYCLTENEGYGRGYERCQGTDIECAWDQNRRPTKFCFQPPEQPQPPPPPPQTQCPTGCECMDPKRALGAGYEWCLRNNDEIPCGNGQYCFRKPIQQLQTPPLQLR
ncbi:unnamed protein product, partial [marine sediment metagenome]